MLPSLQFFPPLFIFPPSYPTSPLFSHSLRVSNSPEWLQTFKITLNSWFFCLQLLSANRHLSTMLGFMQFWGLNSELYIPGKHSTNWTTSPALLFYLNRQLWRVSMWQGLSCNILCICVLECTVRRIYILHFPVRCLGPLESTVVLTIHPPPSEVISQ